MIEISSQIHLIFGVAFFIGITLLAAIYFFTKVGYVKRPLQTQGELWFFKVLKLALGDRYDIFVQVRLASIVTIPDKFFLWRDFNPLGAKCVDYVLCDKKTGIVVLVIELDDKSHRRLERKRRDKFVNNVLKTAGIPILHIKAEGYYDTQKISRNINLAIDKPY